MVHPPSALRQRDSQPFVAAGWGLVATLPLVGLACVLLRSRLDPPWMNHRVHFVLFLGVGAVDFALAAAAGQGARRRGDARVLLISLAFLATGGFLALHAARDAGDPVRARPRRLQGRDPGRPRSGRPLRGGLGVHRRAAGLGALVHPAAAPAAGPRARRHGGVVRLHGRRAAPARPPDGRRRHGHAAHGARGGRPRCSTAARRCATSPCTDDAPGCFPRACAPASCCWPRP
jgi:hypothetical protein